MTETLSIALAQVNPTVGDIGGNLERIGRARSVAADGGADLVVFGELTVCGYPPEDLVLKQAFLNAVEDAVAKLAADTADGGPALLIGAPWRDEGGLHNAALLLEAGAIGAVRYKYDLPNYSVFDEKRVFAAGPLPAPMIFRGVSLGVMVCEDAWTPDVASNLEKAGAEILFALNGSPFETGKTDERLKIGGDRVTESGLPLVYVNLVGGQDELVLDGDSFVLDASGELRAKAPFCLETVVATRWSRQAEGWACESAEIAEWPVDSEAIYRAMVLGLRDYVGKNGFAGVLVGLSGGIDSALSAAVAVDALGADDVHAVMMPSPYTTAESLADAAECAALLGVRLDQISIEPGIQSFDAMLAPLFDGRDADVTEENIQSRLRGNLLMAMSNKFGHMVLTTGNKSEMSVGYATLYGDMCGGYSVLKDVYKTAVFALSRWRNQHRPEGARGPEGRVVPERVITKPPSAELRPNQTDQDTLPPYDVLDGILKCLIEEEMSLEDTVRRGFDGAEVRRVWRMLDHAEYKRRQAPPGVKITRRAFGRDRRYPITNGFTDTV